MKKVFWVVFTSICFGASVAGAAKKKTPSRRPVWLSSSCEERWKQFIHVRAKQAEHPESKRSWLGSFDGSSVYGTLLLSHELPEDEECENCTAPTYDWRMEVYRLKPTGKTNVSGYSNVLNCTSSDYFRLKQTLSIGKFVNVEVEAGAPRTPTELQSADRAISIELTQQADKSLETHHRSYSMEPNGQFFETETVQ